MAEPYQRDSDYCNVEKLAVVSGHVIKYYLYINQPEFFAIDNKDDKIEEILAQAAIVENGAASTHKRMISSSSDEDITQEQIQTLLDDQDSFAEDDNGIDASSDAVNAFADVEDW